MKKVDITICRAQDGTFSAYCNDHPALFGMGATATKAKEELEETLRLTKEDGRGKAFLYPFDSGPGEEGGIDVDMEYDAPQHRPDGYFR
jgi:predicted RNase H-like HicB family nuclease